MLLSIQSAIHLPKKMSTKIEPINPTVNPMAVLRFFFFFLYHEIAIHQGEEKAKLGVILLPQRAIQNRHRKPRRHFAKF